MQISACFAFSVCKVEVDHQIQVLILRAVEVNVPAQLGEEEQLAGLKCLDENIVSDNLSYSHMERSEGDKAGIKEELSVICQSELKQIETKAKQLP